MLSRGCAYLCMAIVLRFEAPTSITAMVLSCTLATAAILNLGNFLRRIV